MPTITEKEIRAMADEWGEIITEITPQLQKADKIKKAVFAWLKTTGRIVTVTGSVAIAKRFEKFGDREVTLTDFLEASGDKTDEERQDCLKVEIKKAENLLGKSVVDAISNRPKVKSNSLELIKGESK